MDTPRRFLFTRLQPRVRPWHLATLYFSGFSAIGLLVLVGVLQPFLLEVFLGVPRHAQGSLTGNLAVAGELALLISVGVWGILNDHVGRRLVYALGFVFMAAGAAMQPLASSAFELGAIRCISSIGIAATAGTLATLVADYVVDEDRGKANGWLGVSNALGAALAAGVVARLPEVFRADLVAQGMPSREAGITAGWRVYTMLAVAALVCALIVRVGLAGRESEQAIEKVSLGRRAREGFAAARRSRGVALAYVTAFVARADLALAGLFLPLWCSRFLQDNPGALAGLSDSPAGCAEDAVCLTIQGLERGGFLIGMVGAGSLLSAPLIGTLCDRINRVHAVAIALAINVVGYGLTAFVSDPFAGLAIPVCVLIGAGEVAGVIATQALVQQHAPAAHRGSVIGCFGLFGALGILVNSWIGGQLFDRWMFQGPFLWLAALNLVVVVVCLLGARSAAPERALAAGSAEPTSL